jgi:Protein of unknown function (DUF3298)/Deacetylase PdaC
MRKKTLILILWAIVITNVWSMETKRITIKDLSKHYAIDIKYPYLEGNDTFNRGIDSFLKKLKKHFIDEVDKNAGFSEKLPGDNTLSSVYEISYNKFDIISLIFTNSIYFKGSAHPNDTSHSMTFYNNDFIQMRSLFKEDSNYLKKLAKFCIDDLMQRKISDANWIYRGAAAHKSNYKNWNLNVKGIEITFDNYQVAPYVYGKQKVEVPLSVFKNELKIPLKLWGQQ